MYIHTTTTRQRVIKN